MTQREYELGRLVLYMWAAAAEFTDSKQAGQLLERRHALIDEAVEGVESPEYAP